MREVETLIRGGDCLDVLKDYPDNFFDLMPLDGSGKIFLSFDFRGRR